MSLHLAASPDHLVLRGSEVDETLNAGSSATWIYGAGGDDRLVGGEGGDRLYGGDGNDRLIDVGGDNVFRGGAGDDVMMGGPGDEVFIGGEGADEVSYLVDGMYGDVVGIVVDLRLHGPQDVGSLGQGAFHSIESLVGSQATDLLTGTEGANFLDGEDGDDTVRGLGGDDYINGYAYHWRDSVQHDLLVGGGGADTIIASFGVDYASQGTLIGGAGNDNLTGGLDLRGGSGEDVLLSYEKGATLSGGEGDDQLTAFGQGERVTGGVGADTLQSWGYDTTLKGGSGDDNFVSADFSHRFRGGVIDGGAGWDRLDGDLVIVATSSVRIDLQREADGHDLAVSQGSISGIEAGSIILGAENDWVRLGHTQFALASGDGDDTLIGGTAADTLDAGAGLDWVSGGEGDDVISGESGATLDGGVGHDLVRLHLTSDVDTTADLDLLDAGLQLAVGTSLSGFESADLQMGDGANVVFWSQDANTVAGGAGSDRISGGVDGDQIDGGYGADVLSGGGGSDSLTGGDGRDVFVFAAGDSAPDASDVITDLKDGQDRIDLTALSAAAGVAVHAVSAFTGAAGEMTLTFDAGGDVTVLAADLDGDSRADFMLRLNGDHQAFNSFIV